VALRNERRDMMETVKKFEKNNIITEDDKADLEKDVQKALDKAIQKLDVLLADKEKEILEV